MARITDRLTPAPPMPLMLTVDETAALLRLHRLTVYKQAREGKLPSVKIGGRRLVPAAAIERLLTVPGGD